MRACIWRLLVCACWCAHAGVCVLVCACWCVRHACVHASGTVDSDRTQIARRQRDTIHIRTRDTVAACACDAQVDGVTDAIVPSGGGCDEWSVERVVVEVKHRVSRVKVPPPLYDQIQSIVYCMMLRCAAADLVQCVRSHAHPCIHITHLRLDDATVRHGEMWHAVVVPRLYAFVRAVLRFRASKGLRYAFLCVDPLRRAALLQRECPHLGLVGAARG